jgi:hypothetical protein
MALLTNKITPWCRVLPEKLTGSQIIKKCLHFMEPEDLSALSQERATCPYPGTKTCLRSGPFEMFRAECIEILRASIFWTSKGLYSSVMG